MSVVSVQAGCDRLSRQISLQILLGRKVAPQKNYKLQLLFKKLVVVTFLTIIPKLEN